MPEKSMSSALDIDRSAAEFQSRGFCVLRGGFNADEVAEFHRQSQDYINNVVPTLPKEEYLYEDKNDPKTLKQLSRIDERSKFFRDLFTGPRVMGWAEALLGEPVTPRAMQWLNKPPGAGRETPPHQDGYYYRITPCEAITFWIALDPVDEENGCIRYVPGSHQRGVVPHDRSSTIGFSLTITEYTDADRQAEEAVMAMPGDVIAHHALTYHRADPNLSDRTRRALTATYFAERARIDQETLEVYQRKLAEELAQTGKI
jgi:phytanoyl-CoA hydroxylase